MVSRPRSKPYPRLAHANTDGPATPESASSATHQQFDKLADVMADKVHEALRGYRAPYGPKLIRIPIPSDDHDLRRRAAILFSQYVHLALFDTPPGHTTGLIVEYATPESGKGWYGSADGQIVISHVHFKGKFALYCTITVYSDMAKACSVELPDIPSEDWPKPIEFDDELFDQQLEQERLDALKATLTQAFEQSGLNEDKRETFLRETFSVITKLQPPKTAACALPDEAPELYVGNRGGKKGGENIIEFLRRVWKPWIEAGVLSRPDLRRLDPKADAAVANWLRHKPLPDDISLPQRPDHTNQTLMSVGIDPENPDMNVLRAAAALYQRLAYQKSRNP